MTARYVKDQTGIDLVPKHRNPYSGSVSGIPNAVTNDDLMAALIVLQKDIQRMQSQCAWLQDQHDGTARNEDADN